MRKVGYIEQISDANRFRAFLSAQGIEPFVPGVNTDFSLQEIWVLSDRDVGQATILLAEFSADPNHHRYQNLRDVAPEPEPEIHFNRQRWNKGRRIRVRQSSNQVTIAVVLFCTALFLLHFVESLVERLDGEKLVSEPFISSRFL